MKNSSRLSTEIYLFSGDRKEKVSGTTIINAIITVMFPRSERKSFGGRKGKGFGTKMKVARN